MIRHLLLATLAPLALVAAAPAAASELGAIAEAFVKLTLDAGEREPGYVDAYYGPAEWQTAAKANPRDVATLAKDADALQARLGAIDPKSLSADEQRRRIFLVGQVRAAQTRLAMMQGKKLKFVDEAEGLFGIRPELKPLSYYDGVLAKIEALLPGEGSLGQRVAAYHQPSLVPHDKLEPVFRAAIAECRARTMKYISLPANEKFDLEMVTKQPWSGYNWYKGNAHSLIQVNTDMPVTVGRAIDLGCHEGYPGHHALNARLEQELAKGKGWVEFTVYPLYSPQSFLAEGSANAGIKLAFPGEEQAAFEKATLFPLAGLTPPTARENAALDAALGDLRHAALTVQQQYLDGEIDRDTAIQLLAKYGMTSPEGAARGLPFVEKYRSYVINYGLGEEMVTASLNAGNPSREERWARMKHIISEPTVPADLTR
ncbi:MAG: hypothetical protein EOP62_20210 [Sphingomonadales bacterium]|nr:MAG: hypothetical protein EOP62_20210 [Sphingomonadales bacterium]